jgi:hypothetical protein
LADPRQNAPAMKWCFSAIIVAQMCKGSRV